MTGERFDAVDRRRRAGRRRPRRPCWRAPAGRSPLVEKREFPRRKVCGECIAASNLPLLDALGIGAAIDARAPGRAAPRRADARRRGGRRRAAAAGGAHRWGRALGRETLDTLLLAQARAAGATVLQPWSVQARGRAGDWRIAAWPRAARRGGDAPRTLHAAVAIDAHGSWEPLPAGAAETAHAADDAGAPGGADRAAAAARADAAGAYRDTDDDDDAARPAAGRRRAAHPAGRRPRRAADLLAFKANFRGAALADGLLPVLSFDGGYGGMVVAGDGLATARLLHPRATGCDALRRAAARRARRRGGRGAAASASAPACARRCRRAARGPVAGRRAARARRPAARRRRRAAHRQRRRRGAPDPRRRHQHGDAVGLAAVRAAARRRPATRAAPPGRPRLRAPLRRRLATPLRAAPRPGGGLRPRRHAAGGGAAAAGAGARLAGAAARRRAAGRQATLRGRRGDGRPAGRRRATVAGPCRTAPFIPPACRRPHQDPT